MNMPLWVKQRIQQNPQLPLSPRELTGFTIGLAYLLVVAFLALRYMEIWFAPAPLEKSQHRSCVLVASGIAKGSESAYKAAYDLCIKGELK